MTAGIDCIVAGAQCVFPAPLESGRALPALYGIESPGLTASLAIADHVTHTLQD